MLRVIVVLEGTELGGHPVSLLGGGLQSFDFVGTGLPCTEALVLEDGVVAGLIGRVELPSHHQVGISLEGCHMVFVALLGNAGEGVALLDEAGVVLRLDGIAEAVVLGLLESIVFQGYDKLLLPEGHFLEFVLHLTALALDVIIVVDAIVEGENQIVLLFGQAHNGGVSQGDGVVALLVRVVIDHHPVHHTALLVLIIHAKDVTVDSVVEGS